MDRRTITNGKVTWHKATYYHEELLSLDGEEIFVSASPYEKEAVYIYSKGLALLCTAKMLHPKRIIQLPLFPPPPSEIREPD